MLLCWPRACGRPQPFAQKEEKGWPRHHPQRYHTSGSANDIVGSALGSSRGPLSGLLRALAPKTARESSGQPRKNSNKGFKRPQEEPKTAPSQNCIVPRVLGVISVGPSREPSWQIVAQTRTPVSMHRVSLQLWTFSRNALVVFVKRAKRSNAVCVMRSCWLRRYRAPRVVERGARAMCDAICRAATP